MTVGRGKSVTELMDAYWKKAMAALCAYLDCAAAGSPNEATSSALRQEKEAAALQAQLFKALMEGVLLPHSRLLFMMLSGRMQQILLHARRAVKRLGPRGADRYGKELLFHVKAQAEGIHALVARLLHERVEENEATLAALMRSEAGAQRAARQLTDAASISAPATQEYALTLMQADSVLRLSEDLMELRVLLQAWMAYGSA